MTGILKNSILFVFILSFCCITAQEDENENSNIQTYTPSKLLEKGKWDVKWFNNLYTQTKEDRNGTTVEVPRSNFFNTSLEFFTGTSDSKKFNAGFIIEYRSNSFGGESTTSVFAPRNEFGLARTGISHIAPSIKIAPFNTLPRFSLQSSFFIPLFDEEINNNGFLSEKSFIWQNRFFYDYTFNGNKFQLFSEFNTRLFFGNKDKGYANNSIELTPGIFLSYFPTSKFTILTFVQHSQLVEINNNYSRNFTAIGLGSKYQFTDVLNIEILYSNFVRGNDTGLGQSFNLGLRAIF